MLSFAAIAVEEVIREEKMTKCSYLAVVGLLLSASAAAQLTPEQKAEIDKSVAISVRAHTQLLEAQQTAMERCDSTRIVVALPAYDRTAKVERTRNTTVTIDWKGGCVDGKRDGNGILNWTEDPEADENGFRTLVNWRAEGRFVKGQRMGLWCMSRSYQMARAGKQVGNPGSTEFCAVYSSHAKALTSGFRKQADGSWLEAAGSKSTLPAGALEAHSNRVLAEAAAGKTDVKVDLVAQNEALDGLLPGAKIALALSPKPPVLKGKRVAIVLSSGTLDEMDRFKRDRVALIAASSQLAGESALQRQRFIAASAPDRLLVNAAKTLNKHNVRAEPVDDLTGLQKGQFDYAIVLDWKPKMRFDLLGKLDSVPAFTPGVKLDASVAIACEVLRGFLISRELKAVSQIYGGEYCKPRHALQKLDLDYMKVLAEFFELRWGKNVDDTGSAMIGFEILVKN